MKLDIEAELKRMHEWIANRGETSIDVRYVEALTRLKRIGELASDTHRIEDLEWYVAIGKNAMSEILRLCGANHE